MAAEDHICDKCPICLKTFCDPRMLPCLHSFCCQCLDHEVEKVGPQHNIQCPTCLSSVPIPMGGASRLPQNLHLEFEVEIARYMSKIVSNKGEPCTFCVNGCTDPAEMFCCTCCKFLCKGAQNCHERAPQLAYHNIIWLNEELTELFPTVLRRSEIYCTQPKHETKELDLYCNTCSSLTCNKCVLEYHKDHNITPLSLIAEAHRDEMKEALQSAHEVMSNLAGAIEANKKMMQQVETSKQEAALAIEHAFGQLMETLEERKKALLAELEAISLSKVTALNLQKEQFEQIQQGIGHHPEMISQILLTHADHEVVALGGQVPSELEHTLKQAKTVSVTPQAQSYLKFSLQANPVEEELSQVGNIVDLSPAPSGSNCMFAPVSKVNAEYIVKVETFSSNGEKYPCGGLQVKAELRPKSHDGPVVPGEVEDHGDGTYTISLTPQTAGPHQLHVTMDGQHVQKSPYDMRVIDYTTLCNPEVICRVSSEPYSVAIDGKGHLYVAGEYSIDVFDHEGNPKNTIGKQGCANGEFTGPIGIFIKGNVIYCADYGNNCIQTLTTQGKFLGKFGKKGSGPGLFNGPWNVVADSKDRLIVSDSDNNRVQVFNQDGSGLLLTIDGNGFNDQSFKDPRGLAIDPDLYIHVVAYGSNTVNVFTPEGTYVRMYGDLEGPIGIAIDEQGYCFVSEERGNCISIFDPYGHKVHKVENLNNPFGIALDFNGGAVYVSNFSSREVLKYTL